MATRVLIVDDDHDLCEIVVRLLNAFGYEAEGLTDPRATLECLRKKEFDLVMVDLIMPHVGGFDLIKMIREEYDVPVIIITGYGSVDIAKAALEAGAADFVTKPIEGAFLDMRIKKTLAGASLTDTA